MVIQAYKQNHLASFIYAVEFCLTDYHKFREYDAIFQEAFNHITEHTISSVLIEFKDFEYNPEVAFDFFGLCSRLIKYNKMVFFNSPYLEPLLNIWIIGIGIEHTEALDTHHAFISNLLHNIKSDLSKVADLD
jgi:hypothetical protein